MIIYHVTNEKRVRSYTQSGFIRSPVRGFTTLLAAMAWAVKVKRTVILEVEFLNAHKLPDHHNAYGEAWWNDGDIAKWKCVFSAEKDA